MSAARLWVIVAGLFVTFGAGVAQAGGAEETVWLRCRASANDVARGGVFPLTCERETVASARLAVAVLSPAETIDPFDGAPSAALPSVAETLDPFAADETTELADPFEDDAPADPF